MAGCKWLKPINTTQNKGDEKKLEEEQPLSPVARLFHAPQMNCIVVAVMGFKTNKIDADIFKEGIKNSLIKHPRFSSKLVLDPKKAGKPIGWIRTQVNIDDHIIVPDLDPNTGSSQDDFLENYVSNITKTPMDLSKPLWEIHLLNIKTKDANSFLVCRIHHSVGDGISLISIVIACTRQTANPNLLPTLPTDNKKKTSTSLSGSLGFLSCFLGLMSILKLFWNTLSGLVMFMATALWLNDRNTLFKRGRDHIGLNPKRFVYMTFSLDDIKLVKNALNVTINDVLLGITQAGLSSYLNRKFGEGDKNLHKRIRLRSSFLVNLRQTSTIEDLAENMESSTMGERNWGNAIGYILFPFHIALQDDPLDYIRDIKTKIDKKKHSLEALCSHFFVILILKIFGPQATAALTHRVLSHVTFSFSNLVGPKEEISLFGNPIVFIAPSVYGQPQALTVHFQSYMDKMTLVLAVDQNVIPDAERLCDDIQESLRLANKAIVQQK